MATAGRPFSVEQDGTTGIVVLLRSVTMIDGSELLSQFETLADNFIRDETKEVVVDFGQIAYFGSNLLEAVLLLWKKVHAAGGKMTLCNLSEVGREILNVARFDTVWSIFVTRAAALEAVRQTDPPTQNLV